MAWQQLTIESIDSLYGSGDRINYCHKARQRRWTMQPLLACPAGSGEEKLSRFPQTPHHKPRRDCLLLQRCKVLGLLQTRNFTLFILISIDKMRWVGLSLGLVVKAADGPTSCSPLSTLLTKELLFWYCTKTALLPESSFKKQYSESNEYVFTVPNLIVDTLVIPMVLASEFLFC